MRAMDLPDGLAARPHVPERRPGGLRPVAAAETVDAGEPAIDLEDIEGDWARGSFDLATESIGVWDGDRLAAAGEVFKGRRADASVTPTTAVAASAPGSPTGSRTARGPRGSKLVGQTVPGDSDARGVLRGPRLPRGLDLLGAAAARGPTIEPQPLPEGYTLREFAGAADGRVAFQLIEDAFNEWPDRDPSSYDDWAPRGPLRPGFEPWQIRFVVDPQGTEVGVCYTIHAGDTGYVDAIAVRRDQRGLGLARALLVDAFERAREHGATVSELSTDSRTGALGLYEHVGMQVTQTWRQWMTDL